MVKTLYSSQNCRLLQWLKENRQEKGLSMRQLADILKRPHSYVEKIEQGERRLDVVEFVNYCEALGINPIDGLNLISSTKT